MARGARPSGCLARDDESCCVTAKRHTHHQLTGCNACGRAGPVASWEKAVAPAAVPVLRPMLLKSLNITAAKAAQSLERIDKVLAHVAALLADGRPYLSGTSHHTPAGPSPVHFFSSAGPP